MPRKLIPLGAVALALLLLSPAVPDMATVAQAEEAASTDESGVDPALAALLASEKASRKACKIEICSILRAKKAEGPDVSCKVVKTMPKKDMDEIIAKAHASWPFGHAHCEADITLKRDMLVKAMTEASYVAEFDSHQVTCTIDREGGDPYVFKVSLSPKVTFENGKAVKAEARWGDLEAPAVAKGVLWPATGLDNQLNILGEKLVETVNGFVTNKCDEVKDELVVE
ncbi:MAG: hypothetical protein R3D33_03855 [Hyphomicrobiaceae bacterium]